jgi:hypothetical protein
MECVVAKVLFHIEDKENEDIQLRLEFDPPVEELSDIEDTPAQNLAGWLLAEAIDKLGGRPEEA